MALIVQRVPMVDDDGSGTTGTVLNNAWKSAFYDDIDVGLTGVVQLTSLTGFQSIAVTPLTCGLRCMNASLLSIQNLPTGFDGQTITIVAYGAGQVDLVDGTGQADGILTGFPGPASLAPGGPSPFHNGRAILQWDSNILRWRLIHHEQGAWLPYTPVWGSTGTANTLGSGALTGAYRLQGRTCQFWMRHTWGAGTVGGSGAFTYSYPFAMRVGHESPAIAMFNDASIGAQAGVAKFFSGTSFVAYNVGATTGVSAGAPFVWTTGDYLAVSGIIEV